VVDAMGVKELLLEDDGSSTCCVCFGGSLQHLNPIIVCETCGISVHRKCVGALSHKNDDNWVCDHCTAGGHQAHKSRGKKVKGEVDTNRCACHSNTL
jgi:hypothetical protein